MIIQEMNLNFINEALIFLFVHDQTPFWITRIFENIILQGNTGKEYIKVDGYIMIVGNDCQVGCGNAVQRAETRKKI
jgi:hypothetical protein